MKLQYPLLCYVDDDFRFRFFKDKDSMINLKRSCKIKIFFNEKPITDIKTYKELMEELQ